MTRWPMVAKCIVCGQEPDELMLVFIIEAISGPSPGLYACPSPCAQNFAKSPYAPDWLHEDLRKRGL